MTLMHKVSRFRFEHEVGPFESGLELGKVPRTRVKLDGGRLGIHNGQAVGLGEKRLVWPALEVLGNQLLEHSNSLPRMAELPARSSQQLNQRTINGYWTDNLPLPHPSLLS